MYSISVTDQTTLTIEYGTGDKKNTIVVDFLARTINGQTDFELGMFKQAAILTALLSTKNGEFSKPALTFRKELRAKLMEDVFNVPSTSQLRIAGPDLSIGEYAFESGMLSISDLPVSLPRAAFDAGIWTLLFFSENLNAA